MKLLYYDCFAGISGDMHLGALLDLGVDLEFLKKELERLPVHGYEIKAMHDIRKGISGTRVQVIIDELHSHSHDHGHHHHGPHHHHHNSFGEIRKMILSSSLEQEVKDMSIAIFARVAEAEAVIHHTTVEDVHFHEIGAVDSIVDIVGAAICIHKLAPDVVFSSTPELGGGWVECAHGTYPVPAPATAEILKNIPVRKGTVDYEATTPTGAAILAATVQEFTDKASFKIVRTGYGIGSKDSLIPNVLRVFMAESDVAVVPETISNSIIECNIDDMNPELYDYVIDALFIAGARDVFITPVIMKKSRPGVTLSVLCTTETEERVKEVLFLETSTIGIRKYKVEKTALERKTEKINTRYGEIRIKSAFYQGKWFKSKPEYEDCIKIAREQNIPVRKVYREVELALGKETEKDKQS